MTINAPTMSAFAVAVVELGLTPQEQQRAQARATLFKVSLTDPDIHRICEDIKMERDLKEGIAKLEELSSNLTSDIDERMSAHVETMKELSASVGNAMSKGAAEVMPRVGAAVADALKAKLEDLPSMVGSSMDKAILVRTDEITRRANEDAQKLTFRKERDKLGIAMAVVAVLLVATNGWSYVVGKDTGRQESAELATAWKRPDMPIWLEWMKYNDARKLQAASCLPEQQFIVNGQPKCKPDMATKGALQSTTGLDGLVAIWREGVVKLGTWGLVGLGIIGTLLTQWTRRRLKKA